MISSLLYIFLFISIAGLIVFFRENSPVISNILAIVFILILVAILINDKYLKWSVYFKYYLFKRDKNVYSKEIKSSSNQLSSNINWSERVHRINEHNLNQRKLYKQKNIDNHNAAINSSKLYQESKIEYIQHINSESTSKPKDKSGYLYIMVNASLHENWLKIGRTQRSPKTRARELSNQTGLPAEFVVAYKKKFSDCEKAEKLVHDKLKEFRITSYRNDRDREFFVIQIEKAISVIENVAKNT